MEGRGKAVKLTSDINRRYILEILQKVPGHGFSAEKISRMFDEIAEKHRRGNESAANPAQTPLQVPLLNAKSHSHKNSPILQGTAGPCTCRHAHSAVKNARIRTYHGQSSGEPHTFTFRQPYSLSRSVWGAVGDTEDKIMDVVLGGISQGRDVREVAADLMGYLKGGPDIVKGRWGKLRPGEKVLKDGHWQYATEEARRYARRLGSKGVDYRAMRLYRSEIHRNQQEAAVEEGEDNPACTGEYDWILMPGRETWLCNCPELAAGGPYTKETIPDYPHSNCDCMVEPILRNSDELIDELKAYVRGEPEGNRIALWAQSNNLAEDSIAVQIPGGDEESKYATMVKRNVDYSNMSLVKAIKAESKWVSENGERTGNELLSFMSYEKKILGTWEGIGGITRIKKSVIDNILSEFADGSIYCIHCHLNGKMFSAKDMNMMCRIQKIGKMIISLPKRKLYFLTIASGNRPPESTLEITWDTLSNRFAFDEKHRLGVETLLPEQENEITMKVAEKMKYMFGWRMGKI
jgi:hypothetical protein